MQLIYQAGAEVCSNCCDSASQPHVHAFGHGLRTLPCGLDSFCDEMERRTAFHGERCSGMMRQHEHIAMVRRIFAPPPFPIVVGPWAAEGTEHVPSYDPGSNILKTSSGEVIVNSSSASLVTERLLGYILESNRAARLASVHFLECASLEEPFHKPLAADAQRVIDALIRACAVAIQRYAEALNPQFLHA